MFCFYNKTNHLSISMSPPSPQLLDLADLWANFNPVLEFLSPKDLALFSNTNKKSLKYVQTLFKFINKSYENSDYGFTRENWYQEGGMRLKFKLPHKPENIFKFFYGDNWMYQVKKLENGNWINI